MKDGYRPKGDISSDNLVPPHGESSIMNEEKGQKRSFGAIVDELLNNPKVMMLQAGRIIEEAKKENEKTANEKKKLEEALIEKDKEISYLKGKTDALQDVINKLTAPIEMIEEQPNYKEILEKIYSEENNS